MVADVTRGGCPSGTALAGCMSVVSQALDERGLGGLLSTEWLGAGIICK